MNRFFILTFCLSHFLLTCLAQQSKIDSLLSLLQKDKLDTNQVIHLISLCWEYKNIGKYDTALHFGTSALNLGKKINFLKGIADSYNNIGVIYHNQGNYEKALESYFASLKFAPSSGERTPKWKKIDANAYNNIGNIYKEQGNYEKALENYFASLKIYDKIGDKYGISASYNNIGLIYWKQGNYEKALENYFASLKIYEEIGNRKGVAGSYHNIGAIYRSQGNYEKALELLLKAAKINEEIENKSWLANNYVGIGIIYHNQGNYEKALENYFASLKIYEEIGDKKNIANSYINIGILYKDKNDFAQALNYLHKGLQFTQEMGAKDLVMNAYQSFSDTYAKMNNYREAYQYHQLYSSIKDSIFNEQSSKQIAEMQTKYDTEKKEQQIKLLEKDKEIQNKDLEKQKTIRNAVGVGLLLVLFFSFVLTNRLLLIRKQKKVIEEKNKNITDSINYASRIQFALLPNINKVSKAFPESFILYKPRDIVSGDFYFFTQKNNCVLLGAVDCTGHGVPGALMTMLGSDQLNQIIEKGITNPADILNHLNKGIKQVLQQLDKGSESRDGMDIALCSFDLPHNKLEFAGANRPLFHIRNGNLNEIKSDKTAIGGTTDENYNFTKHEIELEKNDTIYIFSDGYHDQFGGNDGKKFMTKKFKELLLSIQNESMEEQEKILTETIKKWKGELEQIDDILVIGVRI